jgi:hypothetical protein
MIPCKFFVLCLFCIFPYIDALEYGLSAKHEGEKPITHLCIIGERCSGTNFAEELIAANLKLVSKPWFMHKHFPPWYELPIECYFGNPQHYTFENTDEYLFVIIFRNAYDWARSLQQKPHHAIKKLHNLPFSKFIRTQWSLDPSQGMVQKGKEMNPLIDLSPITKLPFNNVLELRTAKIRNMLMINDRASNVYIINYEIIRDYSQEVIQEIANHFDLSPAREFSPITTYLGYKHTGTFEQAPYASISIEDLFFINSQLSEEIENSIEYSLIYDPNEIE